MSTPRPTFQTWFATFVAVTGVLSLFPYRERALLPAPSANEVGLLAQQIRTEGSTNLVNDTIAGPAARIARDTLASSGARRLIPALARATDVPGTSTLTGVLGGQSNSLPGTGTTGGNGVGVAGGANGTGNLAAAGASGALTTPPGQSSAPVTQNPVTGPQGPAVLAGAAGELLAAVVPEPSTWLLFVAGMMIVGQALRTAPRRTIRSLLRS